MLNSLKSWFQSDDRAKLKLAFILGVTVLLVGLITLLFYLNTQQLNKTLNQESNSLISQNSNQDQEKIEQAKNTLEDNLRARKIERVSSNPINSLFSPIFDQDGGIIFTDELGNLYKDKTLISESNKSYPISTYIFKDNVILNEGDNVLVVNLTSNEGRRLPAKFYNLIVVGDFVFSLEKITDNGFIINRYSDIPLTGNESNIFIGSGEIENKSDYLELRKLGKYFVIFDWSFGLQRGNLNIYEIISNKITFVKTIESISDFKIEGDLVLMSFDGQNVISTFDFKSALDVAGGFDFSKYDINFLLSQANINDDVTPRRCNIKDENILYCFLKKDLEARNNDIFNPDDIVQIDLSTGNVSKVYNNLVLSGRTLYWSKKENTHFFVSQLDNKLYKIIDE